MRPTALRFVAVTVFSFILGTSVNAQSQPRVVTTAVPFLRISPDARSGGMGDLSLATTPDVSSPFFNLGKVPFNTSPAGVSVTYTPWLKNIVNDVFLASIAGYYKIDDLQSISGAFRYFSLGSIQFTDDRGQTLGSQNPRELGIDAGYSRRLSDRVGLGVGMKFIYSNLASGQSQGTGATFKPGTAVAADLGLYYNAHNEAGQGWAFGAALSNLGSKIGYTDNADQKDFIPANFGIGTFYTKVIDESNKISFGVDLNKLLVPTPPADTSSAAVFQAYRDKGVISSWFSSFGDAPGGFGEELKEFQISAGGEYNYNDQFAFRAGYFHEGRNKGNRRYFTVGVGVKYNVFGLNFSYLVPTGSGINQNPLSNTLRFSLLFDLSGEAAGDFE